MNKQKKGQIKVSNMVSSPKIIIGNWKMNKKYVDIVSFSKQINRFVKNDRIFKHVNTKIAIAPTYMGILVASGSLNPRINICAQNVHHCLDGAYTGSVAIPQLSEFNVKHVIIGHSEVREYNQENNKVICEKVKLLLDNKMFPVLCVGETLAEYNGKNTYNVISKQLREGLKGAPKERIKNLIVAYEPIWAIGTGKTATPAIVEEVCTEIKKILKTIFKSKDADLIPVLYGGSVKETNAAELLKLNNVDGLLVGGASLVAQSFIKIISATPQYCAFENFGLGKKKKSLWKKLTK